MQLDPPAIAIPLCVCVYWGGENNGLFHYILVNDQILIGLFHLILVQPRFTPQISNGDSLGHN